MPRAGASPRESRAAGGRGRRRHRRSCGRTRSRTPPGLPRCPLPPSRSWLGRRLRVPGVPLAGIRHNPSGSLSSIDGRPARTEWATRSSNAAASPAGPSSGERRASTSGGRCAAADAGLCWYPSPAGDTVRRARPAGEAPCSARPDRPRSSCASSFAGTGWSSMWSATPSSATTCRHRAATPALVTAKISSCGSMTALPDPTGTGSERPRRRTRAATD